MQIRASYLVTTNASAVIPAAGVPILVPRPNSAMLCKRGCSICARNKKLKNVISCFSFYIITLCNFMVNHSCLRWKCDRERFLPANPVRDVGDWFHSHIQPLKELNSLTIDNDITEFIEIIPSAFISATIQDSAASRAGVPTYRGPKVSHKYAKRLMLVFSDSLSHSSV